ncbi:hypothetical protein [Muriicola marianensis]|uniref:Uncharacterized protein n=1 Tax=Muriicola marianensis TaxID=1324801 RepID=A0ABQ1QSG1_9FLAO|nr:hypothetical protein [Muriicola marianensis]GGD40157.1 hypothetical protein GCM10011361_04090 [Muriicola marianensis]
MTLSFKRIGYIFLGTLLLLCIPLIAMQFSSEVDWNAFDFLVAGILLASTAFVCDLVWRNISNDTYRIVLLIAALVFFFLIWAELAVGIFGTPFAGS